MWPGGPLGFTSLKLSFAPESNMKTLLFLLWGMWHLGCVSLGAWEALPLLCSPSQASCGHTWARHVLCVQGRGGGGGGLLLCGWSGEEGMEGPVCRGSVGPCQVDEGQNIPGRRTDPPEAHGELPASGRSCGSSPGQGGRRPAPQQPQPP